MSKKKPTNQYIVHLRPSIDITYEIDIEGSQIIDNEIKKVFKNAIKQSKILSKTNTKIKYISMCESYTYTKKDSKDNVHPNFIIMDSSDLKYIKI